MDFLAAAHLKCKAAGQNDKQSDGSIGKKDGAGMQHITDTKSESYCNLWIQL